MPILYRIWAHIIHSPLMHGYVLLAVRLMLMLMLINPVEGPDLQSF